MSLALSYATKFHTSRSFRRRHEQSGYQFLHRIFHYSATNVYIFPGAVVISYWSDSFSVRT
jgi:hypothetical protein